MLLITQFTKEYEKIVQKEKTIYPHGKLSIKKFARQGGEY